MAPQGLRCALPEESLDQVCVDGDEPVLGGHPLGVVGVVDRPELNTGVLVDEVVQAPGPECRRGDHLVPIVPFQAPAHRPRLDEVDDGVGDQLAVDAQMLAVVEQAQHGAGTA